MINSLAYFAQAVMEEAQAMAGPGPRRFSRTFRSATTIWRLWSNLSALEEKMVSIAPTRQTEEELFQIRRDLDALLRLYRGKMTAEQPARLEKQYLDRGVMESA